MIEVCRFQTQTFSRRSFINSTELRAELKRHEFSPLADESHLELLGNKALLEKRINIRAADYRFADKAKYYLGYTKGKQKISGTMIRELRTLAKTQTDFTEEDILIRNEIIFDAFVEFLAQNNLLR